MADAMDTVTITVVMQRLGPQTWATRWGAVATVDEQRSQAGGTLLSEDVPTVGDVLRTVADELSGAAA